MDIILTINGRKIALAPFKYFFCIMGRFRRKIYFIGRLSAVRPKMLMNVLQFSIYFISATFYSLFFHPSFFRCFLGVCFVFVFLFWKFLAINKIIWNISSNGQKVSKCATINLDYPHEYKCQINGNMMVFKTIKDVARTMAVCFYLFLFVCNTMLRFDDLHVSKSGSSKTIFIQELLDYFRVILKIAYKTWIKLYYV